MPVSAKKASPGGGAPFGGQSSPDQYEESRPASGKNSKPQCAPQRGHKIGSHAYPSNQENSGCGSSVSRTTSVVRSRSSYGLVDQSSRKLSFSTVLKSTALRAKTAYLSYQPPGLKKILLLTAVGTVSRNSTESVRNPSMFENCRIIRVVVNTKPHSMRHRNVIWRHDGFELQPA